MFLVIFRSSEPRAAREKVKLCCRPTVTQKKNKAARDLGGDSFYTKQDFLAKSVSVPTLSTVEYFSG